MTTNEISSHLHYWILRDTTYTLHYDTLPHIHCIAHNTSPSYYHPS